MNNLSASVKPETAGSIADARVPVADIGATIADVEKILIHRARHFHSLHYIYVLDSNRKVQGVLSVREVFSQTPETSLISVMQKDVLTVSGDTDAESAALLALQKELTAIPVVNNSGTFIGVITSDSIMRLLHGELTQDLLQMSGVSNAGMLSKQWDDVEKLSVWTSLRHRLPWLIFGLIGGLFAARIVHGFESVLEKNIILAAYIPLIVYMGDAVGTQMEAFIIRDFALRPSLRFSRYFLHQFLVVLVLALVLCGTFIAIGSMLYGDVRIAWVIGLSLGAAIVSSMVSGLLVPYSFGKLKMDPANASGPIATILQDIMSIAVYFWIASILL